MSLSNKGCIYNIVPLDIIRKADKFLIELLDTKPSKPKEVKIKTVKEYYEQLIKPARDRKKCKVDTQLHTLQGNNLYSAVNN